MKTLAIGRNNRRLAIRFSCEAGSKNLLSSGSHGIRVSGIKGGNTRGKELLLAVAEAKAGAGVGSLEQPGMRSPRLVSVYECPRNPSEYVELEVLALVTRRRFSVAVGVMQ